MLKVFAGHVEKIDGMSGAVMPKNLIPSSTPVKPSDEANPAENAAPLQECCQNSKQNGQYLSGLLIYHTCIGRSICHYIEF